VRRWFRRRRHIGPGVEVLDGLVAIRVHELLAEGSHALHANLTCREQEWPLARRSVRVHVWMTGFEAESPVQWSGVEHEGEYDGVGFWDQTVGGKLVLWATLGGPAHLWRGDRVLIAAGHLYGR
jgi:hypothetical protein